MDAMIPYGKQDISDDDINAVIDVLKSDYITQGPKVIDFENVIANYCQAQFAIATNSATSALHIACLALAIGKNDRVWTSPISFVASANCALYCQASVDFIDIDIATGNVSIEALKNKLKVAEQQNTLPKAIIVVHLAGQPCAMEEIQALAKQYKFAVIEDASHAIGAKYNNNPVGGCQFSDITIFSFHPVKIITSAEGGMATTNNAALAKKMRAFRSHGIEATSIEATSIEATTSLTQKNDGPWYYEQTSLGFNYRMTELQAALGISQFSRLDTFVKQRNERANIYNKAFENTTLSLLKPSEAHYSSYHLYIVLLPKENASQRKAIITQLRAKNIFAHVHYIPIHTQPYYQQLGFNNGDFPIAEDYYERAISLPLFPSLTKEAQHYIINTLINLL